MKTLLTLVIIEREGSVLLGKKKRGFGEGRWNGFGGKVEEGESIVEAAHRELQEECGVTCPKLEQRGIMTFTFDDSEKILEVHVFHSAEHSGEPIETDEMAPKWFVHRDIPYDDMWTDDKYWMPAFLKGKCQLGTFHFSSISNDGELLKWAVEQVDPGAFSC